MSKLNNKGIGHHLLLLVVAVVAVAGAAGYFVWNRQKDSGIDAKAADYNYQNTVSLGMGAAFSEPAASFLACSQRVKSSGNYLLNTKLVSKNGPAKGTIKINNKVIQTLTLSGAGIQTSTKQLKGTSVLEFDGTWSSGYKTGLPFIKSTLTLQDIIPCDYFTVSKLYKYKTYSSDLPLDGFGDRNISYKACKIPTSNNQFILDTVLIGLNYSASAGVQTFINNQYSYITNVATYVNSSSTAFGWPRPKVTSGTLIGFSGSYFKDNQITKLYNPMGLLKIDEVPNCQ